MMNFSHLFLSTILVFIFYCSTISWAAENIVCDNIGSIKNSNLRDDVKTAYLASLNNIQRNNLLEKVATSDFVNGAPLITALHEQGKKNYDFLNSVTLGNTPAETCFKKHQLKIKNLLKLKMSVWACDKSFTDQGNDAMWVNQKMGEKDILGRMMANAEKAEIMASPCFNFDGLNQFDSLKDVYEEWQDINEHLTLPKLAEELIGAALKKGIEGYTSKLYMNASTLNLTANEIVDLYCNKKCGDLTPDLKRVVINTVRSLKEKKLPRLKPEDVSKQMNEKLEDLNKKLLEINQNRKVDDGYLWNGIDLSNPVVQRQFDKYVQEYYKAMQEYGYGHLFMTNAIQDQIGRVAKQTDAWSFTGNPEFSLHKYVTPEIIERAGGEAASTMVAHGRGLLDKYARLKEYLNHPNFRKGDFDRSSYIEKMRADVDDIIINNPSVLAPVMINNPHSGMVLCQRAQAIAKSERRREYQYNAALTTAGVAGVASLGVATMAFLSVPGFAAGGTMAFLASAPSMATAGAVTGAISVVASGNEMYQRNKEYQAALQGILSGTHDAQNLKELEDLLTKYQSAKLDVQLSAGGLLLDGAVLYKTAKVHAALNANGAVGSKLKDTMLYYDLYTSNQNNYKFLLKNMAEDSPLLRKLKEFDPAIQQQIFRGLVGMDEFKDVKEVSKVLDSLKALDPQIAKNLVNLFGDKLSDVMKLASLSGDDPSKVSRFLKNASTLGPADFSKALLLTDDSNALAFILSNMSEDSMKILSNIVNDTKGYDLYRKNQLNFQYLLSEMVDSSRTLKSLQKFDPNFQRQLFRSLVGVDEIKSIQELDALLAVLEKQPIDKLAAFLKTRGDGAEDFFKAIWKRGSETGGSYLNLAIERNNLLQKAAELGDEGYQRLFKLNPSDEKMAEFLSAIDITEVKKVNELLKNSVVDDDTLRSLFNQGKINGELLNQVRIDKIYGADNFKILTGLLGDASDSNQVASKIISLLGTEDVKKLKMFLSDASVHKLSKKRIVTYGTSAEEVANRVRNFNLLGNEKYQKILDFGKDSLAMMEIIGKINDPQVLQNIIKLIDEGILDAERIRKIADTVLATPGERLKLLKDLGENSVPRQRIDQLLETFFEAGKNRPIQHFETVGSYQVIELTKKVQDKMKQMGIGFEDAENAIAMRDIRDKITRLRGCVEEGDTIIIKPVVESVDTGKLLRVTELPSAVADNADSFSNALTHPKMAWMKQELERMGYHLCVDTSLGNTKSGAYFHTSGYLALSLSTEWTGAVHEFQHALFKKYVSDNWHELVTNFVKKPNKMKDVMDELKVIYGKKGVRRLQSLIKRGLPHTAINEQMSVDMQLLEMGFSRKNINAQSATFYELYATNHAIDGLQKITNLDTVQRKTLADALVKKEKLVQKMNTANNVAARSPSVMSGVGQTTLAGAASLVIYQNSNGDVIMFDRETGAATFRPSGIQAPAQAVIQN